MDAGLDQVVEEVGPEGDVGQVGALLAGDLDQHRGAADVGIGHGDAEPDVAAAAPAAGPHEDEALRGQRLVDRADGPRDAQHGLPGLEALVVARVDEDHILEVADLPHLDVAVG